MKNNALTSSLFLFSSSASPTLTPPSESSSNGPQMTISAPNASPQSQQQPTLPPTPPTLLPPPANGSSAAAASYLPPFPFHMSPEMMPKHPFLPYDLNALAAARALHHQSPYSLPAGHPHNLATESSRLSPVSSSRPSSSSPTSSSHHKLNSSMDLHDSDSEDEPIDVVKSAFVPILRPKLELADSTTTTNGASQSPTPPQTEDGSSTPPPANNRPKCDLKAPSSRKSQLHIIAPQSGQQSPETKLTKPQANGHNIAVWRPY